MSDADAPVEVNGSRDDRREKRRSRRSRSRSRSKSSRRRRRRSRSSSSSRRKRRSRSRSGGREEHVSEDDRKAERDKYTVFVAQIHPKVDERVLFEFFSHVGKVSDIRLIRDQRTQKSKGLCYVEFFEKDSVTKALALTGQLLGGYPITIQLTQSEKNLAKEAAAEVEPPLKLYVSQLHPSVGEDDLRPVFEAFGELDFVDLKNGFGHIQYKRDSEGRQALAHLNGLEIAGKPIALSLIDVTLETVGNLELDDDTGGGLAMTAQSRASLMQKLQRGNPSAAMGASAPSARSAHVPVAAPSISVPMIQPSTCVVVKNMFDPATERDPNFDLDIKEDVTEECVKYGPLKHILVDKNSQGFVYLRFETIPPAMKIVETFNGRWFAGRQIKAEFVIEPTYLMRFPEAK